MDSKVDIRKSDRNLYGFWLSPYTSLVAHFLSESGISYNYRRVSSLIGDNSSEDYLRRNPIGKIPTFEDANGLCIYESSAICRYLARSYPAANEFYPLQDAERCAEVDALNDYLTFSVGGPFFNWFTVTQFYPNVWKLKVAEECEAFGKWSMMLVRGELSRLLSSKGLQPYLLGQQPCLADFHLFWLIEHGKTFVQIFDAPEFELVRGNPALEKFYNVMTAREATQEILSKRSAEFEQNRQEILGEMKTSHTKTVEGLRPIFERVFGHPV